MCPRGQTEKEKFPPTFTTCNKTNDVHAKCTNFKKVVIFFWTMSRIGFLRGQTRIVLQTILCPFWVCK